MDERAIKQAYATYDSDPRAGGPDDRDAFVDAVTPLMPDRAVVDERLERFSDELIAFVETWIERDGHFENEAVERAARWAAQFGWTPKDERGIHFAGEHDA